MDILFHSGTETTSGTSESFGSGNMGTVGLFVNVTAKSGTLPTLIVNVQHSPDNITWYDVTGLTTTSIGIVTTVSITMSTVTPLADYVRVKWTIGGANPSFTFTADLVTFTL